jgi:hypothetical protein
MLNLFASVVSFVAAAAAGFPDPATALTLENSVRVGQGRRTLTNAEGILGCPPGDYRTKAAKRQEGIIDAGPGWSVAKWYSDSFELALHIDDAGRSHGSSWRRTGKSAEWPDRFVWRIKWHWQASFRSSTPQLGQSLRPGRSAGIFSYVTRPPARQCRAPVGEWASPRDRPA